MLLFCHADTLPMSILGPDKHVYVDLYVSPTSLQAPFERGASDNDFVFVNSEGNAINRANLYARVFVPALEKADLPRIRIHDLRHLSATYALRAGQPLADVAARLGHASVTTTLNFYSHAIEKDRQDQAEQLAGILFGTAHV